MRENFISMKIDHVLMVKSDVVEADTLKSVMLFNYYMHTLVITNCTTGYTYLIKMLSSLSR